MENHVRNRRARRSSAGTRIGKWFGKKIVRIVTLALTVALVIALLPYVRGWIGHLMPGLDFARTSELLSHQMEEVGELIADRHTDTGIVRGKISVFVSVEFNYIYEVSIGIKLADVKLTPLEGGIEVAVPQARVLADSFTVDGEPRYGDLLNLREYGVNFQNLVDEQHAACRQSYEDNEEYMQRAWEDACKQLGDLFGQWSGEQLPLSFVPLDGQNMANAEPAAEE